MKWYKHIDKIPNPDVDILMKIISGTSRSEYLYINGYRDPERGYLDIYNEKISDSTNQDYPEEWAYL